MEIEDQVVCELDVVLNGSCQGQLCLIQYPLRPRYRPYGDQGNLASGKLGDNSLELTYSLDTSGPNYDRKSNEYDKKEQILQSKSIKPLNDYCIGVIRDNTLCLTPIQKLFQMRPKMDYIDSENTTKSYEDKDEEENLKAEKESKRLRIYKKKDSQRVENHEKWSDIEIIGMKDESSLDAFESLIPTESIEVNVHLNSKEYVSKILPEPTKNFAYRDILREMPISLQVEDILKRAEVINNESVVEIIGKHDGARIEQALLQKATIIQGRWVCKSELLNLGDLEKLRDICLAIIYSKGLLEKSL